MVGAVATMDGCPTGTTLQSVGGIGMGQQGSCNAMEYCNPDKVRDSVDSGGSFCIQVMHSSHVVRAARAAMSATTATEFSALIETPAGHEKIVPKWGQGGVPDNAVKRYIPHTSSAWQEPPQAQPRQQSFRRE